MNFVKCKECGRVFGCNFGSEAERQQLCGTCFWKFKEKLFSIVANVHTSIEEKIENVKKLGKMREGFLTNDHTK